MKQKEFRDLLVQYVEEISDPKNKEEYDQYLKQLENQQELPKGMQLIHPKPCFCLKSKIKNKKNTSFNQKLFVNICMAPELEKPTQEKEKNKENEKGQQWHIPYSCGKIRMDQDKGNPTPHISPFYLTFHRQGRMSNSRCSFQSPHNRLLSKNRSFQKDDLRDFYRSSS